MDYNSEYSAVGAGIGAGIIIFSIAFVVLVYASLWKIFVKAGKPGWAALVPIYNTIVLIEIVGKPTIWILWLLVPCVNIVFAVWLTNLLSKSFGKTEGFTIGLLIFPMIFYPILGFGSAQYIGPSAAEAFGGFNNQKNPFNQPPTTPSA